MTQQDQQAWQREAGKTPPNTRINYFESLQTNMICNDDASNKQNTEMDKTDGNPNSPAAGKKCKQTNANNQEDDKLIDEAIRANEESNTQGKQTTELKDKMKNTKHKTTEDIMDGLDDYTLELHLNSDKDDEDDVITPEDTRKQIGSIVTYNFFFFSIVKDSKTTSGSQQRSNNSLKPSSRKTIP